MHKIPTDAFDMLVTLEKRPFERAALAGPRLSVFMQFIIRAPSDQYHWVFCQTGLPTRGKPHQHYHSEGIPDHVSPYHQMHPHSAQAPRADIIPPAARPFK